MKTYQERIRDIREDADLTQTEVAKELGIRQTVYSRYERGENLMPITHLVTLAKFYGTSADYLLGLTDNPSPIPPPQRKQ